MRGILKAILVVCVCLTLVMVAFAQTVPDVKSAPSTTDKLEGKWYHLSGFENPMLCYDIEDEKICIVKATDLVAASIIMETLADALKDCQPKAKPKENKKKSKFKAERQCSYETY